MVLTPPLIFAQTDGIVSLLLDHTCTKGPSVTCMRDFSSIDNDSWYWFGLMVRPSKCPNFNTTMLSDEKNCTPKRAYILSKLKLQQIVAILNHTLKLSILIIYPTNTLLKLKNNFFLSFPWTVTHKRACKFNHQHFLQQNPVCLEQQIYASQENFTKPLVVMVETFRRCAHGIVSVLLNH